MSTHSLWAKRDELPTLPLPGAIVSTLFLCLIAALSAQSGLWSIALSLVGGSIFAAILLLRRSMLALCAPIGCTALILTLADSFSWAILSLLLLPLGASAAVCIYWQKSRLASSVWSAGVSAVFCAIPLTIRFVLSSLTIAENITQLRSTCITRLSALTLMTPGGERLPVFSIESAEILTDYLLPFLPAAAAISFFLLGCATVSLVHMILTLLGARADFFPSGWDFRVGRPCAVLFCGAQLFVLLAATTPQAMPLYYAALNIALILMPPLAIMGLCILIHQMRTHSSVGTMTKIAIGVLALMLLASGLYWFCTAAALYGVYNTFRRTDGE